MKPREKFDQLTAYGATARPSADEQRRARSEQRPHGEVEHRHTRDTGASSVGSRSQCSSSSGSGASSR